MKKAAVYTGKGDDGTTSLMNGERVLKDDIRVEAYGTIDELCACLGLLQIEMDDDSEYGPSLAIVQNKLFAISAFLADTHEYAAMPISGEDVAYLEGFMDKIEISLPRINSFLLPSSVKSSLVANLCRTVCRRAERRIVSLSRIVEQPGLLLTYMNRLSDYFFLLSRLLSDGNEKIWENHCK